MKEEKIASIYVITKGLCKPFKQTYYCLNIPDLHRVNEDQISSEKIQ